MNNYGDISCLFFAHRGTSSTEPESTLGEITVAFGMGVDDIFLIFHHK